MVCAFFLALFTTTSFAQEVVIPDRFLRGMITRALGEEGSGRVLTEQDMLRSIELRVQGDGTYGVRSLEGLGAAHHLKSL